MTCPSCGASLLPPVYPQSVGSCPLHAAGPEMLNALRLAQETITQVSNDRLPKHMVGGTLTTIEAAIAKAGG